MFIPKWMNCISLKSSWPRLWLFSCSVMSDSVSPWPAACQASLSTTSSQNLFTLVSIDSVMPSNHSRSPPSPSPFSLFQHGGLCQWVGSSYCGQSTEDSVSVLPMNSQGWFPLGLTGLILAAHETFNSLLHHYSSKASVLQCSAFSMVQLLISWVRASLSVVSDSLWLHGWYIACQIPCSWNFPGKNTGVGSHSFFQEIFPMLTSWTPIIFSVFPVFNNQSHNVVFAATTSTPEMLNCDNLVTLHSLFPLHFFFGIFLFMTSVLCLFP